jgi:DNA invertase Pin-like site-specific DNA recombinase
MQKAIAYYRVSTGRQGRSGLGLEAQQRAVYGFIEANGLELVGEWQDVESGRKNERQALEKALLACRQQKAVLVIAKLDRLSRSVAFISMLIEAGVDFKVVDNPYAEKFTLHILAAVAEKEREDISLRTSLALEAARIRGVELGKYGKYVLSKRNNEQADVFAAQMAPVIEELRSKGFVTIRAITNELNRRKMPSYRNNEWYVSTVYKLIKRIKTINSCTNICSLNIKITKQ